MSTRLVNQEQFKKEYGRLNAQQKSAVDTIEGPVMVIAGAGTGKTQTIALRIANILAQTQTPPGAILCLTFTENAAANMRRRPLDIIGPPAYSVRIHTFHSFCNEVILSNPQHFIFAAEIEPLDELEKIEIIRDIIENLPNGSLLKPWGDHFYYQREIISRLQTLKRENILPQAMGVLIDAQKYFSEAAADLMAQLKSLRAGKELEPQVLAIVDSLLAIPNLSPAIQSLLSLSRDLHRQGHFQSEPAKSPAVNYKNYLLKIHDNLLKAIPKQEELKSIYSQYQEELKNRGKYDFDDMILFVLNAFKTDSDLLLSYQERFQYILVDEYQDTNTAQNNILDLLGAYFEIPNIFVVGDDDQSIFRFQGAAIENIFDFYQKYKANLKVVVLKNNYRSHQLILDSSQSVISYNKNRIANYIKDIDKSLKSIQEFDPDPINLFVAPHQMAENYYVAKKIKSLISSGVSPGQIAVLYRNNNDVADLLEVMHHLEVAYRLETGNDILENPHIRQIVTLLTYLNDPHNDTALFKLLTYPFLKINAVDLFKLVRYAYRERQTFSDLINSPDLLDRISDSLRPATLKRLKNFRIRLAKAQKWQQIYSLDKYFNKVIRRFGFLPYLLSLDDVEEINCLKEFYTELKRLSAHSDYTLDQFLSRIQLLSENRLSLPSTPVNGDYSDTVRLMTVHKAKGLEFEHVFLIKVVDKKWGNNVVTTALPLPMGILRTELSIMTSQDDNEEERRLFYVALTRAKKQLYISYSAKTDAGRDLLPSMFLSEIDPDLLQHVKADSGLSSEALRALFPLSDIKPYVSGHMSRFLQQFIKKEYKFNVSHLNSYLKCPLCFYYKTILRIPSAKDKFASLGTAVHHALSYLFNVLRKQNTLITKQEFLSLFEHYLKREDLTANNFEETLHRGREALSAYYDRYQNEFDCSCLIDYDFAPDNVFIDGIPVTGKIDKVEILNTKSAGIPDINVVDFKTGNPDSKASELKLGSDYFRQLVFYKLLADADPHFNYHVVSGTIDFVQPSKRSGSFVKKNFKISDKDETEIRQLITDIYQKILNLEFSPSPDCPDTDDLHRLAK